MDDNNAFSSAVALEDWVVMVNTDRAWTSRALGQFLVPMVIGMLTELEDDRDPTS